MASYVGLLDRLFSPDAGGFSAELSRHVLAVDFSAAEHERVADLSDRVQSGTLSAAERAELEGFAMVDAVLTVLQAKARTSLRALQPSVA